MRYALIILLFPMMLSAADFVTKWTSFETAVKAKFKSFDNNVNTSLNNFETSVNSKLDSWATNHKRALDDFEARTRGKLDSTFTNMERELDGFEKSVTDHLDSTFDKAVFDNFESKIDSTFSKTFDETREDFKDMKNSLKDELGETYDSTVASDVDAMQSDIADEGASLQAIDGVKQLLDEAADEAETEAAENVAAEEAENNSGSGSGAGTWSRIAVNDNYNFYGVYWPIAAGDYVVGGHGGIVLSGGRLNTGFQAGDDVIPLPDGCTPCVWFYSYYDGNLGFSGKGGTYLPGDTIHVAADGACLVTYGATYNEGNYYYSGLYLYPAGTEDPGTPGDEDNDGIPDDEDSDSDGNGVDDAHEDTDENGIPDDEEVDVPDTKVDFKTGIPGLDNLINKLTPSLDWAPDSRSEYSLDIPIETDLCNFTISLGGWDSVCGGALSVVRSAIRLCSKVAFSFFFLFAVIKSLRQW